MTATVLAFATAITVACTEPPGERDDRVENCPDLSGEWTLSEPGGASMPPLFIEQIDCEGISIGAVEAAPQAADFVLDGVRRHDPGTGLDIESRWSDDEAALSFYQGLDLVAVWRLSLDSAGNLSLATDTYACEGGGPCNPTTSTFAGQPYGSGSGGGDGGPVGPGY